MIIVDCPLCDLPAPFEPETGSLECEPCAARLELAGDDPAATLAAAA